MYKTNFKISNINCEACTKLINRRIASINDVSGVSINLNGIGNIISNRKIERTEVENILKDTDYKIMEFIN